MGKKCGSCCWLFPISLFPWPFNLQALILTFSGMPSVPLSGHCLTWTTATLSYLSSLLWGLLLLSLDCRAHNDHPTFMLQTLQLLFLGRFRSFRSLTYRILPSASPSSFLVLLCFTRTEFLHFFTEPRPLHSKPLHTVSPLPQTFLCPFRFLGKQCFS